MKNEVIKQIFEQESFIKKQGKIDYFVSDEKELHCWFDLGSELLAINRIKKISIYSDFLRIETLKGEIFYLGSDAILKAVKTMPNIGTRTSPMGFTEK